MATPPPDLTEADLKEIVEVFRVLLRWDVERKEQAVVEGKVQEPVAAALEAGPRPGPVSAEATGARTPPPPESPVGVRSEMVHVEKGKLIGSVPIRMSKPKRRPTGQAPDDPASGE
ncbi:MAG: hypothetical protein ACHREM_19320 [Polyangiales bacterium]